MRKNVLYPKAKAAIALALVSKFESKASEAEIAELNTWADKAFEAERLAKHAKRDLLDLAFKIIG